MEMQYLEKRFVKKNSLKPNKIIQSKKMSVKIKGLITP